ncbi:hypothetical protein WN48_09530 [Eufriesea mexicana]|nr:hypothetical protein WN48_09530 [Eufriesea mexicana]
MQLGPMQSNGNTACVSSSGHAVTLSPRNKRCERCRATFGRRDTYNEKLEQQQARSLIRGQTTVFPAVSNRCGRTCDYATLFVLCSWSEAALV